MERGTGWSPSVPFKVPFVMWILSAQPLRKKPEPRPNLARMSKGVLDLLFSLGFLSARELVMGRGAVGAGARLQGVLSAPSLL